MSVISLQLGDFIQINNDTTLLYIDYIDDNQLRCIHTNDGNITTFPISSLQQVVIVNRADSPSYAIQHGLLPSTRIQAISTDNKVEFEGIITDLQEDMIEIKVDDVTIYIDFGYHGIPLDLPIQEFVASEAVVVEEAVSEAVNANASEAVVVEEAVSEADRVAVEADRANASEEVVSEVVNEMDRVAVEEVVNASEMGVDRVGTVKTQLKKFILQADQISFGEEELSAIKQEVESTNIRYDIDTQVADLLDDLLSTIPTKEHTYSTMMKVHRIIERYRQLRQHFSTLDKSGNVESFITNGPYHKPLKQWFYKAHQPLSWLIPVTVGTRKIYDVKNALEFDSSALFVDDTYKELIKLNEVLELPLDYSTRWQQINALSSQGTHQPFVIDIPTSGRITAINQSYSCVNDIMKVNPFVPTQYSAGLTRLYTDYTFSKKGVYVRKPMLSNDVLYIKEFITRPFPYIYSSRIYLPASSALLKSDLHQIVTYELDIQKPIQKQMPNKNIVYSNKEHVYSYNVVENKVVEYEQFVNSMIPNTNQLFASIKKYITNGYSLSSVLAYLEPFLIYKDDLIHSQYKAIMTFVYEGIANYIKQFVEKQRSFAHLTKIKFKVLPSAYTVLNEIKDVSAMATVDKWESNAETLWRFIQTDGLLLYTTILSLQNQHLLASKLEFAAKVESIQNKDDEMVIAKTYYSLRDLELDNGYPIYFDVDKDHTYYGLLDEKFAKEKATLSTKKLVEKVMAYVGEDKKRLAETLVHGKKKVLNGDYAILYDMNKIGTTFYKRSHETWVYSHTTDSYVAENLTPLDMHGLDVDTQFIIKQFDALYQKDTISLQSKYDYYSTTFVPAIIRWKQFVRLWYNNQKLKWSKKSDGEIITSPYASILQTILSQTDLEKRNNDIIRFTAEFLRDPVPDENSHWKYCVVTNIPLLPTFKYQLAIAFGNGTYNEVLNTLKSTIGVISDDGDMWTDKHSGWTICKCDFDTEEGYNEAGFKEVSRDVLETDADNLVKNVLATSAESGLISALCTTFATLLGFSIEGQKPFIVRNVQGVLDTAFDEEPVYIKKVQQSAISGKKMPSYEEYRTTAMVYCTLSMFIVATQTSIPSVKSKKIISGCDRSFDGYPLADDVNDKNIISYISCVAFSIRGYGTPWSILKKTSAVKIQQRIKVMLDTYFLPIPEVSFALAEKRTFLASNIGQKKTDEGEEDIHWDNFLPPLKPIHIGKVEPLSKENIDANKNTFKLLLTLTAKQMEASFGYQEEVSKTLVGTNLLLKSNSKEPFIENSCCYSNNVNQKWLPAITDEYIDIVRKVGAVVYKIKAYFTSPWVRANAVGSVAGSVAVNEMSSEVANAVGSVAGEVANAVGSRLATNVIQDVFAHYCKFNSYAPIPAYLLPICPSKQPDTIFTYSQFLELYKAVCKQHVSKTVNAVSSEMVNAVNSETVINADHNVLMKEIAVYKTQLSNTYASVFKKKQAVNKWIQQLNAMTEWEAPSSIYLPFYYTYIKNFSAIFPSHIHHKVPDVCYIGEYHKFSEKHIAKLKTTFSKYYAPLQPLYKEDDELITNEEDADEVMNNTATDDRTKRLQLERLLYKSLLDTDMERVIAFIDIYMTEKTKINMSSDIIKDKIFKQVNHEKNLITDLLKSMTDEKRNIDTMMKITGQGRYNIGAQKGLTSYKADFYDNEDEIKLRDALQQIDAPPIEDIEAYDISNVDDDGDYYDGNVYE